MNDKGNLRAKVDSLPDLPGVYIYKDAAGEIIYIGKAKSLKKRVQSYFSRFLSAKTQAMVAKIAGLEHILTPTESQAQLLEAALIKEKQPQYNISLKDDKSFPLIRISGEDFPVVSICRQKSRADNDSASYFGPYTSAQLLRQALKVIRQVFGFRSCKSMPKIPCLYYRLKLCPGPCADKVSRKDYQGIIEDIRMFLDSRYEKLIYNLALKMERFSKERKFEDAGRIRDQISALSAIAKGGFAPGNEEMEDLKKISGIKDLPLRIEGFDISNISGKEACGSMVSFYKGSPDKDNYRRFRIKTVSGIDDYSMLREAVRRRYSRLKEEKRDLPDLVLIDGGKQHFLAAEDELRKLGLDLALISIAKKEENIYTKRGSEVLKMRLDSPGLNLIRRVRDEAHRFALKYHHLLHKKKILE
ncbi:MAG: excinuclease ABC subunit UvrC [Candidatus Omnitrophica bacterium]|jgi:excinuclease ABC subunit C|nr:excinuclease ABC subunit UvrC [Candidatus Omnitrophota bacterium]MDD5079428.1 excinuclease ABC subunit UvrC [Candidatus Omnitrophota bacterium]